MYMLVDRILEYYGLNPIAYGDIADKWIVVFSETLLSSYIYFPIICAAIPVIYLFLRRKKYAKDKKIFRKKVIKYALIGLAIGLFLPYAIIVITAGLAQRDLYGG